MGDEGWFWDRLPKGGCGAPLDCDSSPEKYSKFDETKLVSPKRGYGSSLRELRNGESISGRTLKAQKELVYQHELASQIKEKERAKLLEEKKKDEIKLRELDEYLSTYYKGRDNVPSHMKKYMRNQERQFRRKYDKINNEEDDDDDIQTPPIIDSKRSLFRDNRQYNNDNNDDDDYANYSSKSHRSHRGNSTRRNDNDRRNVNDNEQSDYYPSNRRSREKYSTRNRDDDYDDYDDVPSGRWSGGNAAPNKTSPSRSKHKSKGSSNRDGWVTQEEYNKLSELCENLMHEQDKLLAEVRRQMEVIKELKLKIEYNKSTKGSKAIPKNNRIRDHLPKISKGNPAPAVAKHNPKNVVGASRYGRKLRPNSELPNYSALYSNPYEDDLGANGLNKALRRAKGAKSGW